MSNLPPIHAFMLTAAEKSAGTTHPRPHRSYRWFRRNQAKMLRADLRRDPDTAYSEVMERLAARVAASDKVKATNAAAKDTFKALQALQHRAAL